MRNMGKKADAFSITQKALMRTLMRRAEKGEGPLPEFHENHMDELAFADIKMTKVDAHLKKEGKIMSAESYSFKQDGVKQYCGFNGLQLTDSSFVTEKYYKENSAFNSGLKDDGSSEYEAELIRNDKTVLEFASKRVSVSEQVPVVTLQ